MMLSLHLVFQTNFYQRNGWKKYVNEDLEFEFKTSFTKEEIEQLKDYDGLAIDWSKVVIKPVKEK